MKDFPSHCRLAVSCGTTQFLYLHVLESNELGIESFMQYFKPETQNCKTSRILI